MTILFAIACVVIFLGILSIPVFAIVTIGVKLSKALQHRMNVAPPGATGNQTNRWLVQCSNCGEMATFADSRHEAYSIAYSHLEVMYNAAHRWDNGAIGRSSMDR